VNEAVNEPVDPSEFELEKLGLEPGDWVQDERTQTYYAYGIAGGSEVAGVVVDLDGEPVASCEVTVRRPSDSLDLRHVTTAGDGAFRFKDLPEERLSVEAYLVPPGGGIIRNTARTTVEPGATDVRLVLPLRQKAEALPTLKAGEDAPELVLEEGAPASLGALKGKAVVLAFVSIYSRSSARLLAELKALQAEEDADKVAVIAVHDRTATSEEIERFRKDHGIPFPIVRVREADQDGWEGATFRAYGVTRLPMLDLVGPTGKIVGTDLKPEEVKTRLKKSE
jgi:peroxiredoxin